MAREPTRFDIPGIQEQLRVFSAERDWEQFHSPKNLAMALAVEVAELLEIFQWLSEAQSRALSEDDLLQAKEEIADIQILLLRIADVLGVSIPEVVTAKIETNAQKYPVDLAKGNATKATRRKQG